MTKKNQRKLLTAWNEAEEVARDLEWLDKKELDECREAIGERVKIILNTLDDFIDEDVFQELV